MVRGAAGGGPVQRVDVLPGDHTARLLGPGKQAKFSFNSGSHRYQYSVGVYYLYISKYESNV